MGELGTVEFIKNTPCLTLPLPAVWAAVKQQGTDAGSVHSTLGGEELLKRSSQYPGICLITCSFYFPSDRLGRSAHVRIFIPK